MKNNMKKILAMAMAIMLCLAIPVSVSAATTDAAVIDPDAACSLSIYKYDFTNAAKDGVWTRDAFTSTGVYESYVNTTLGGQSSSLGNGQTANGYAIKGVEFTYLKTADISTFTESADGVNTTVVLYGFDKTASADLLTAIGLSDGASRYTAADSSDKLDASKYYYTSDVLIKALANALEANSTTVKNALETYIVANGGTAMPLTDSNGYTTASNLPVGLYLLVETAVPEMVTSTVNPFFVSLPMTTVDGNDQSASHNGGQEWNYDVTVYPKNLTGIPTLEKTVREAVTDTGKNNGSNVITDGYAHNATGSAGDVMEYQFVSTLPTITSQATALTTYQFYDTLSEGLEYNKSAGVKAEFFTDDTCTNKVATWDVTSGKFSVSYSNDNRHMTVDVTSSGLAEINGDTANENGALYAGYSNYTVRVTYSAVISSDASFVCGDNGNDNKVVLTWKRSSQDYYDTLIDDCHVYSFGMDLTKVFSDMTSAAADSEALFQAVKFKIYNETDGYWLTATRNDAEGIYYVTGHVGAEADATIFYPVTSGSKPGKIVIRGMEDDAYVITEIETANGYTLLKDSIRLNIHAEDNKANPCDIYSEDVLGVLQNDPYYAYNGGLDLKLANIPQKALAHNMLTASATVDQNDVSMRADNDSPNALASMSVVNTRGFDLPKTGETGNWMYGVFGVIAMAVAGVAFFLILRKKDEKSA